ncbi:hypothetical protein ACWDX8_31810 [Streptomyces anthocyanicus]
MPLLLPLFLGLLSSVVLTVTIDRLQAAAELDAFLGYSVSLQE